MKAILRPKAVDVVAADAAEPVLGPDENVPLMALRQRQNRVVGEAVRNGQSIAAIAVDVKQSVARANPHRAIVGAQHRLDGRGVGQRRI